MTIIKTILKSMKKNTDYRPCDIAAAANLRTDEAEKILKLMTKGGIVEVVNIEWYRKVGE